MNLKLLFGIAFLLTVSSVTPLEAEESLDELFKKTDNYQNVTVQKVVDTATLILSNDERIRLIGLRSPEIKRKKENIKHDSFGFPIREEVDPATPIEEQALTYVTNLLLNQTVTVELDVQKKGDGRATLAYIFLKDGTLANAEILKQGFAYLSLQPPNLKYADQLRAAYKEAKDAQLGLQGE
ncbi:MAG: hypothetical protein A2Z88_09010 [Omnitrophica WOR_2 bacterium GWA2_47_8]|nr:MAG: hypothetical protein A2Z88_09010 [Omnitrophica WOR_2 bacterium GWA2_47_8]